MENILLTHDAFGNQSGILLPLYAPHEGDIHDIVRKVSPLINRALSLRFREVIVLIPSFVDRNRNRASLALLSLLEKNKNLRKIKILTLRGEQSDILNRGLRELHSEAIKYAFIVSSETSNYLVPENLAKMYEALCKGAFVTGLAIRNSEIKRKDDLIYKNVLKGCISNTFAAWEIKPLNWVGNFDSFRGAEEIAPIIRLLKKQTDKKDTACIAPIIPFKQLSLEIDKKYPRRYQFITESRETSIDHEVHRVDGDLKLIKKAILRG